MNFSIIIPSYNRAHLLQKTLKRLTKCKYTKGLFEILIVNNNSSDQTNEIVQKFISDHPSIQVRLLHETKQGRSFAANKGIKVAKYNYVISIDDDILVPSDFLNSYAVAFTAYPHAHIIGGKIIPKTSVKSKIIENIPPEVLWTMGHVDLGNIVRPLVYPENVASGNFAINKNLTGSKVFSTNLGCKNRNIYLYAEDFELCIKFLLRKKLIIYDPRIKVFNQVEENRLNYTYVLKRLLISGIEIFVVDNNLKNKYQGHLKHVWPFYLKPLIKDFLSLKFFDKKYLFRLFLNIAFEIGYFLYGRRYVKNINSD